MLNPCEDCCVPARFLGGRLKWIAERNGLSRGVVEHSVSFPVELVHHGSGDEQRAEIQNPQTMNAQSDQ